MANLLTDLDISDFTTVLRDHFDTFKRDITIYRRSQVVTTDINSVPIVGYSDPSINNSTVTYTSETGVFSAIRMNKNNFPITNLGEFKLGLSDGEIRIKVEEDAMRFIEQGGVERIVVDEISFNLDGQRHTQNYLGQIYYIYYLKMIS